jgi:hypothetical protein
VEKFYRGNGLPSIGHGKKSDKKNNKSDDDDDDDDNEDDLADDDLGRIEHTHEIDLTRSSRRASVVRRRWQSSAMGRKRRLLWTSVSISSNCAAEFHLERSSQLRFEFIE